MTNQEAYSFLAEKGAHFILCNNKKAPISKTCWDDKPTLQQVLDHEGKIGVIPHTVNLAIVDLDKAPEGGGPGDKGVDIILENIKVRKEDVIVSKSGRQGGRHILFGRGSGLKIQNREYNVNGYSGEFRTSKTRCYAITWSPQAWVEAIKKLEDGTLDRFTNEMGNLMPKLRERKENKEMIYDGVWQEGDRNREFNNAVYVTYKTNGDTQYADSLVDKLQVKALRSGLEPKEIEQIVKSSKAKGLEAFDEKEEFNFIFDSPEIDRLPSNLLKACLAKLGVETRINARGEFVEYRNPEDVINPNVWSRQDRSIENSIREAISKRFTVSYFGKKPKKINLSIQSYLEKLSILTRLQHVDPFLDYVESLPKWDGKERLEEILIKLFKCEDTKLNRWAGYSPYVGAIARAYQPGCKLDEMVILSGPQGTYKSTYWNLAFPPSLRDDFFTDSLSLTDDKKQRVETSSGCVFVECSEFRIDPRTLEGVKQWITSRVDRMRWPYDPTVKNIKRRFILVGTTNSRHPLPSDEENRRFIVVHLGIESSDERQPVIEYMNENREQLWAEALSIYNETKQAPYLPQELHKEQRENNIKNLAKYDVIENNIYRAMRENPDWFIKGEYITMHQICYEAGLIDERKGQFVTHPRIIGGVLRQLGWSDKNKKVNGKSTRVWKYEGEFTDFLNEDEGRL